MLRSIFLLFCILLITTTFCYQLNDEENDIELTEEDVKNLLKTHILQEKADKYDNLDENDEGEELTEDHIRELLHRYMNAEQVQNEDNDDKGTAEMLEKLTEKERNFEDEKLFASNDNEIDDEIDLLNEINDDSLDDEELDMSALKTKDPKALWGRFRVRFPRIRLPRIRLPRIRLPRIRLPRIRIRFPRIRLPRFRLPRIRLRRIRWPRIRMPRIRFRFIRPVKPSNPSEPNPCPYNSNQILNSINSIKCDKKWKDIFDYPVINDLIDNNEFFITACKQQTVCLGCMNKNPWNIGQCNSKLKSTLTSFCKGLADGDAGTLEWCNNKVDKIIAHENKKTAITQLYYCQCGEDVTDIGKPY